MRALGPVGPQHLYSAKYLNQGQKQLMLSIYLLNN